MQPLPILPTKLYIPQSRHETVIRHRLLKTINENFKSKMILVAAPAGFGKTTLVCNWIQQLNLPVAWYSIGKEDNDPVSFYTYVISALQTIDPLIGESSFPLLRLLQPDLELVLTNLIQEIITVGKDIVLVLEDFHCVKEKQINSLLEFLINHKSGHLHMVIASRSDPLLPLHRYRAKNQLVEIRAGNLCFSDEEAYAFFNKVMGLSLSSKNVKHLNHRTEGWITGLQMAALSLKSHDNIEGFVQSFTGGNRYVMDYLLEEVIAVQTGIVKTFLLRTSILDRFSNPLCEAVTGIENCQKIIDILDRENLFLIALDSNKVWYRYHHLFSHLLRKKLREIQPELLPELHKNASRWYADNDYISEAIDQSIAAMDFQNAAHLVELTFMNRMIRGEDFATMLDWLKALPEEMICSHPSLCIMYAWMHSLTYQLERAESLIQFVEEKEVGDLDTHLRMQIEVIRAEMARYRGELRYSIQSSLDTLEKITKYPSESPVQAQNYTGCVMNLAWAYLNKGEVKQAVQKFQESIKISEEMGSITMILLNMKGLAQAQMLQGGLKAAGRTMEHALTSINQSKGSYGQLPTAAAFIYLEYGNYLRELNQLSEANRYIRKGLDLGIARRIDGASLREGYISLARTKFAQQDIAGSLETIHEADLHLSKYYNIKSFKDPLDIWQVTLALASVTANSENKSMDDKKILEEWTAGQDMNIRPEISSITDELSYILWARWFIYKNQYDKAGKLLDHLFIQAKDHGRNERFITILILKAIVLDASGHPHEALRMFSRSLDLAASEGYLRIFLDEGMVVSRLLKSLASNEDIVQEWKKENVPLNLVRKLIFSFETTNEKTSATNLSDPLSKREKDVLLMLSSGLSNNDIAGKLYISKDTVKSHLKNINVKLNTGNRKQAVERASELGLL